MDSYDLFGDDVSGSVLDGLPDLGSEAFGDSSATGPGNYFILIGLFLLKLLRPVYFLLSRACNLYSLHRGSEFFGATTTVHFCALSE